MKQLQKRLIAIALAVAVTPAFAAKSDGHNKAVGAGIEHGRQFLANEMIVQFRAGATEAQKGRALGRIKAEKQESIVRAQNRQDGKGDVDLVSMPVGLSISEAMRGIEADDAVEFAEPNWIYTTGATSNDPQYTAGSLWGMYGATTSPANQFGSGAAAAWAANKTCNSNVYVGVIDEGIMTTHEDLAANMWVNPFDPPNGIDDDGNGYVDDTNGWDFANKDRTVFDGTTDDHGTHVAGTIAGVGGNGRGVAGVCWQAKLISAKFLGRRGGTTADAISAVRYLTDLKLRHGLNIVATNNSWGGGGFSQALKDAIDASGAANIVFVAAAGNETNNNDANPSYPGSYASANIISVASITSTGGLSSFSNYGANSVDIGAPGSAIMSTLPVSSKGSISSGYGSYSGTSMATPHVSGAVALYASLNPGASAFQIINAILTSATPTPSLAGKTVTGGRLNVSGF